MTSILCINGSDSMGHTGIQADIRTIKDLGGYAVTAVSSVTVQNSMGITHVHELPTELVIGQVKAIYEEMHPDVVKIGMVNNPQTIHDLRSEIVGCKHIVCSPVIQSSFGGRLMSEVSIQTYCRQLLPICTMLIIKCADAEIMLGHTIRTEDDMRTAAQELHEMGAKWVLLRGGTYTEGRINALLSPSAEVAEGGTERFFSSINIEGWQRHGVGGTLSTAIATRIALGDDVPEAVSNAHNYLHSQVVYASTKPQQLQSHSLYDRFLSLLSDNFSTAHDVAFYAGQLSITTRYLSQITNKICGRSPKQIIDDYIIRESVQLLMTTTLTIQQISYQLGFTSQIAFAKFFKAKKNCSPSSFRNRG